MRPITPRLLLEILRLARCNPGISPEKVRRALLISRDRCKEVLNQMESMGLMLSNGSGYQSSDLGVNILRSSINEDFQEIHKILLHYPPYTAVYNQLQRKSLTLNEIAHHAKMSKVAADIVLRLIGWTHPQLTRNSQTGRYYIASDETVSEEEFLSVLFETYSNLSAPSSFGMRRLYVKISTLRALVCERLGITQNVFDELLRRVASELSDRIELVSAPTVGVSEKPFTINPRGKHYYYIRIEGGGRYGEA